MLDQSFLEKTRAVASILSAAAIPVVLALVGYSVQQSIAEDGIKKDYLTMAIAMLKDGGEKLDPELKGWATAVVSKYSPVPFSVEAKSKLGGALYITPSIPDLPEIAKQPDISSICSPGCSSALLEMYNGWQKTLSGATKDDGVEALNEVLQASIRYGSELAGALDMARLSGNTCVKSYQIIQGKED